MEKRLMTVNELSEYMATSVGSIYTKVCERKMPPECIVKIGRALRFDKAKIDIWLDSLSARPNVRQRGL